MLKDHSGFTLLELLSVIALFSTVLLFVIPHYIEPFTQKRLEYTAKQLVSSLQLAREAAIRHHNIVTVCPSHDKINCGGNWTEGWIVLSDQSSSQQILGRYPALDADQILKWKSVRKLEFIKFHPSGTSLNQNGRFTLCNRNQKSKIAWLIDISQTGRIRLKKIDNFLYC